MKKRTLVTALSATIALGVLTLPLTSCATKTTGADTHKSVKQAKCGAGKCGAKKAGKAAKCGAKKGDKAAKCGSKKAKADAKCGAGKCGAKK